MAFDTIMLYVTNLKFIIRFSKNCKYILSNWIMWRGKKEIVKLWKHTEHKHLNEWSILKHIHIFYFLNFIYIHKQKGSHRLKEYARKHSTNQPEQIREKVIIYNSTQIPCFSTSCDN